MLLCHRGEGCPFIPTFLLCPLTPAHPPHSFRRGSALLLIQEVVCRGRPPLLARAQTPT